MDLALLVYGISLLSGIGSLVGGLVVASSVAVLLSIMYFAVSNSELEYSWSRNKDGTLKETIVNTRTTVKRILRVASITLIVSSVIAVFIPSEKTAYVMVGAYVTQKVAENEKVQETGQKVLAIINQKLDDYVQEGIDKATKKSAKESK